MSHLQHFVPSARSITAAFRHRHVAWLSALGLCGFCSCTTVNSPTSTASRPTPAMQSMAPQMHPQMSPQMARQMAGRPGMPGRTSLGSPTPQGIPPHYAPGQQHYAAYASRPAYPQQPGAIRQVGQETAVSDRAVERMAAVARTPAICPEPYAAGPALGDDGASPTAYPDEYLFDGGDRDYPITRDLDEFRGLDTEDTIAEFEDENGKRKIKKTNRVAIYAPRFGSVVAIHGPNAETIVDKVHGHVANQGGINLRSRTVAGLQNQKVGSNRMDTRLRANGIGTEISTDTLNRDQGRRVEVAVMNTHESLSRLQNFQFESKLPPTLLEGMSLAEIWTRKQNPIIEGHATSGSQAVTIQGQATFVGVEDNGKRGDLRLYKTADKGVAAIGDVVTFTILYENAGDRDIRNVAIIDNLTPRLEYIPEGTSTDRPGKVETEDNGEGSVILRFVLDEPLPGRTKGSITFQARVR